MKALLGSMMVLVLAGCASQPNLGDSHALLADARFTPPARPVSTAEIFQLDDAMHDFAEREIRPKMRRYGASRGLFEALQGQLTLDYDAERTRSAADTFATRSGNCLSLVILTAAFARALDIPIVYRSVDGHDTWSRAQGIAFRSGHVNLELGSSHVAGPNDTPLIVDFLPPDVASHLHVRAEPENTVIAMYLNNRAAEAVVDGDVNGAYWFAREASLAAPAFLSVYNTLGVIYLRHGDFPEAERALRRVLERQPDNAQALGNLVVAVSAQGRASEAQALRERLARIAPYPPFYFLDAGLRELEQGRYDAALALLERERRRMPYDDEVHFAIALADFRKGDLPEAREHLSLALENSTTRDRRDIYAAKLQALRLLESRN